MWQIRTLLRLLLAGVAAFVTLLAVEIYWHDGLFSGYYESIPYIVRDEPRFTAPTMAGLFRALLMATIYPIVRGHGSVIRSGLVFGGVIGLLTGIYWIPTYYAQVPIPTPLAWFMIEGAFFLVQGAAAGLVIALVFGKSNSPQSHGEGTA